MGSPRQHAMEKRQNPLFDQRNELNRSIYNKNKKAIDIFQKKLQSDINAQIKMRGLDPKSKDPAVRKILNSIGGRAESKNNKFMRSLGISVPKQRPTGTPVPKQRPTGTPVPIAKESPASINNRIARRKKLAEARARQRLAIANRQRNSKDIEKRMKQLAIDRGRTKGTKSTVGDRSLDIEKRMKQLAIERGRKKLPKLPKQKVTQVAGVAPKVTGKKPKLPLVNLLRTKGFQDLINDRKPRSKRPTSKKTFART